MPLTEDELFRRINDLASQPGRDLSAPEISLKYYSIKMIFGYNAVRKFR